jgi:nucleoside-diphosphate-sugar epimerase
MRILITGASGNLGSHLARYLGNGEHRLRLLIHSRSLPFRVEDYRNVTVVRGDLADPSSLVETCREIDCIVHLAGVLFRPRPERFLPTTNTLYARHLVDAALSAGVRKFILISFPHIEGVSTPERPATGALDVHPTAVHARTRLAAEQYLFHACRQTSMQPVVLRAGVVYGRGVKLIEAARRLLSMRLLAIWRRPTWLHLLALPDLLHLIKLAIERPEVYGIYNLCDDQPLLLQEFLDELAIMWGYAKPWRLPAGAFFGAAVLSEVFATVFRTAAPLNRDIVKMGMMSVVADTSRMKNELLAELSYPTLKEGRALLV